MLSVAGALAAVALAALIVPSAFAAERSAVEERLKGALAMSVDQFQRKLALRDDELMLEATISSESAWRERGLHTLFEERDVHLQASVDKASGIATFRVHGQIIYGRPQRNYVEVSYAAPGALPKRGKLERIIRSAGYCRRRSECPVMERFQFPVDEAILRRAAEGDQGGPQVWRMRFRALSGDEWDDGLSSAEVLAVLKAVDAYRSAKRSVP